MRASNILWDAEVEEMENLPTEIPIPKELYEEAVSDYITMVAGFCHKGFALKENPAQFEVNNRRKIELSQNDFDGNVIVTTWGAEKNGIREVESEYTISPADFIMLLNLHQYIKETGNPFPYI